MDQIKITNHTENSKMHLMQSISTSPLMNKRCLSRSKNCKSICSSCYSFTMNKMYKGLRLNLQNNTNILTTRIITPELLNNAFFRFEAFGDLNNEMQLHNYVLICNANKHVNFALWSKNYDIIKAYFADNKKPRNLQINFSSPMVNKVLDLDQFPLADRIFTVFTKDYAFNNDIRINCGKKQCIKCQICYKKNSIKYVNEIKK